ncbi:MAG TPA: helix-hairpin-helix domain-containing protein, partial [Nitrososphaeraceae archaeon]|nr:helix-hairpin-helix domain-containing protein [Nitrososphaeraceae archaeon]
MQETVKRMIDKTASQENEADSNTEYDIAEQSNVMPHTSSVSPTVVDLEIQDIEGVGPTTAKKLKEAGIISVMDLAVATAETLSVDINSSKETAATFIMAAQRLLRDSNI